MITRRTAVASLGPALWGLLEGGASTVSAAPAHAQPKPAAAPPPAARNATTVVWEARPAPMRLRPDSSGEADVWGFNAELAPVLRVRRGNELRLTLKNRVGLPLSLHFHGVRGPNAMDGGGGLTQEPVLPQASFDYRFTPPDAGTFLIRPCVLGGSAEPLGRGLSGLLIVEEDAPWKVGQDLEFLIDDWLLDERGALAPFEGSARTDGRLGNFLTVNGKAAPLSTNIETGSDLIRIRVANACNARTMRLRFDGFRVYVTSVDGQPTDTFQPLRATLPFAPGTRYDLLAEPPTGPEQVGTVTAEIGSGLPLLFFKGSGAAIRREPPALPRFSNEKLPKAIRLQSAARKEIVIRNSPGDGPASWTVNGSRGSASAPPLLTVKRGTPVVLALVNETPLVQPMHLHGHVFRLLHPFDDGWEPYFLDTLQVPEKKTLRIAFVADNPGRWLVASTVMERFDAGLWTSIEVT
jgi:FtsP/CotA-like multicopper oxidase with cupredoxin domain